MQTAIGLDGVDAHRRRRLALEDISFEIPRGAITSVVGPNGAGKSTLLGLISGRLKPTRGQVRVDGQPAEVPQAAAIEEGVPLSVEDVVTQGRYRSRGLLRPITKQDRRIVGDALEAVDLLDHRRTPISELSGGQRQRTLVAQGLAQQSSILLLDEPMTGVDLPLQRQLGEVIREVADDGVTVMYSTHDLDDAGKADLTVALCCRCVCCAPSTQALNDPRVTQLFEPTRRDRGADVGR